MSYSIRKLQDKDLREVCELALPLCSPAFHWPREKLRGQLTDSNTETFVYEVTEPNQMKAKILAFICLMDLGPAVEIPVLGTALEAQRQGVMKRLFQHIIAAHYGRRELWLEVHEKNQTARNLYRTLAFVESGQRPDYYQDGGAAIMCNRFPSKA